MAPYGRDVLARIGASGQQIVLVHGVGPADGPSSGGRWWRYGSRNGRIIAVVGGLKETQGAIGFADHREASVSVVALPAKSGLEPVLMGFRFYGSPALIAWFR